MVASLKEINFPIELVNEDGTSMDDFPKNPLEEKWLKQYPPMRNGEPCSSILSKPNSESIIYNYSCVLCHEKHCPYSDDFVVPDEDKELYEDYQKEVDAYNKLHGNF